MALPDVPTRSPLRGEVPTIEAFLALAGRVDSLESRVTALENINTTFPGSTLFPSSTLYPKAG